MTKLNWFWEAFLAMVLLVPAWLGLSGLSRAWHIRGEVALLWYMMGVVIGVWFFTIKTGSVFPEERSVVWWLFGLGLIIGTLANVFSFRAVAHAPNVGLPVAITGSASVFVFFSTLLLARAFPHFFSPQSFNWYHFFGVVCTSIGIALIATHR